MRRAHTLDEIHAAHARHYRVREQEVDSPGMGRNHGKRLFSMRRFQNSISLQDKRFADRLTQSFLVFHDEDRAGSHSGRRDLRCATKIGFRRRGQPNPESRALCDGTLYFDIAATLLHDAIDHRQTQAASLTALLGREKRIEDASLHFRRHSPPGIGNRHLNVLSGRDAEYRADRLFRKLANRSVNYQTAAMRHCIARIYGKVQQYLLELRWIHFDLRPRTVELHQKGDVLIDRFAQQLFEVAHERIDFDDLRLQGLFAAECQQLSREPRRTLCGARDRVQLLGVGGLVVELLQQHLGIAAYDHQQIVEVMRDSACQPAYSLHFDCMPQLFLNRCQFRLCPLLRRDVFDDGMDPFEISKLHRIETHADITQGFAVRACWSFEFDICKRLSRGQHASQKGFHLLDDFRSENFRDVTAYMPVAGDAIEDSQRFIDTQIA